MERLPGFRDFYPEPVPSREAGWSADARNHLFSQWRETARRYGFREYDGPPLEPLELYTLKSGQEIVGQLYNFTDKGDRAVALRPEMTPTLARMIAAHERSYKKPVKWFAIPQLFRYERQQKGRLREHFQFNADILGEKDPAADAELIALLIDSLRALGLTAEDFVVRLSSRNAWQDFYESGKRKAEIGKDDAYEFFQIIDKLEREEPAQSEAKLAALGFSLEGVNRFIQAGAPTAELDAILRNLAARGLADFVQVDYHVIRGLAYYTGPVFEVFDRKGEFRAIAGGGRYDNLIRLISGGKVDLPALGFGMGDVVLTELLRARGKLGFWVRGLIYDVYWVIEDEALRGRSLRFIQELRDGGLAIDYPMTALKADKQQKRAIEIKARTVVWPQCDPSGSLTFRVRNLESREEESVEETQLIYAIRRVGKCDSKQTCP
jgi:histidyl-tRNA synthetase